MNSDTILIGPDSDALASIVFLHGLGADGHDFVPVAEALSLPPALAGRVRFLFPNAPVRPVSVNGGHAMPAWFDIHGLTLEAPVDEAGIDQAVFRLGALIARERALGVPAGRIVLAGFSQGGVVALHAALFHGERLGGVAALSTWLPLPERLVALPEGNRSLPVFIGHGEWDDVVPCKAAERLENRLAASGMANLARCTYPMAHSVSAQEIDDLGAWMGRCLVAG